MKKLFGTDGIRGVANQEPMTPETVLRLGKAIARFFLKDNGKRHSIVIGKDTRLSGYLLETALTSGIVSMGVDVLLVGPMPTPAIAHLIKSLNADAGIVLSASHNPAEHNGIKIFDSEGYKLSDDAEMKIERLFYLTELNNQHIKGNRVGKACRINDADGRYIEFAKNSIGNRSLEGMKVVLDCANGAAYRVAPMIFSELGAEVITLNNCPDGLNINLNCGALYPEEVQKKVKESNADIGIALDGDADRVIVCDEKGCIVDGDHIMAIIASDLKERGMLKDNTVVATVMSNKGFENAMKEKGITVVRTKVGDRYVIDEIRKLGANFGGEQSGHIIFGNYTTTGDGIIAVLQLMSVMEDSGKKLSQLSSVMKSFPQILVNVEVKIKKPFEDMPRIKRKIKEIEESLNEKGRILVRYSGTENIVRIMIEGQNKKEIERMANEIASAIKKEIGA